MGNTIKLLFLRCVGLANVQSMVVKNSPGSMPSRRNIACWREPELVPASVWTFSRAVNPRFGTDGFDDLRPTVGRGQHPYNPDQAKQASAGPEHRPNSAAMLEGGCRESSVRSRRLNHNACCDAFVDESKGVMKDSLVQPGSVRQLNLSKCLFQLGIAIHDCLSFVVSTASVFRNAESA